MNAAIIGADRQGWRQAFALNPGAGERLVLVSGGVEALFALIPGPKIRTDARTAEMLRLRHVLNAFFATAIGFISEIANLCKRVDADVSSSWRRSGFDDRVGGRASIQPCLGSSSGTSTRDPQVLRKLGRGLGQPARLPDVVWALTAHWWLAREVPA